MASVTQDIIEERGRLPGRHLYGRIVSRLGLERVLPVGGRCAAIGSRRGHALLLPCGSRGGIGLGGKVERVSAERVIPSSEARLGRVVSKIGLGVRAINTFLTCRRGQAWGPAAPGGAKSRGDGP